jgi:hypothetical protein
MSDADRLRDLIKQARHTMHKDQAYGLNLGYRLGIYSVLGPRADSPDASDLHGYKRRVLLERLTAERLLPIWEKSLPREHTPSQLLSLAMRVLEGELSVADAWHLRDELLAAMPNVAWPLRGVMAAAGQVLRTATVDIDFNPTKPDYTLTDDEDWEEDAGYRDAAGWGAYVMAGGTVHDAEADPSKRLEFWDWWLTEAVPAAWHAVQ